MTSADLTEQLRASRPLAPGTLRERVRAIATVEPAPSRVSRFRLPRLRLVVPVAAATAIAAAALIAGVRPEQQRPVQEALTGQSQRQLAPPTQTTATDSARVQHGTVATAPKAAAGQAVDHLSSVGAAPAPAIGRAQDYQAQIGLEVKDNDALSNATKRAMTIARSFGGYVVAAQYASSDAGSASLTLRVPSVRVQDAIVQLTALGKITSQQVQIQDLQELLDQLDRQIVVLNQRIAHITALLADPDLTPERQAQLRARRAQLQSVLRGTRQQRTGTAQAAALATIQLSLATKDQSGATPVPAARIDRTLDQIARILTWEGVALLYAFILVAPFALVGALAWFGTRLRRRNVEARLLTRS